jgi:hypothetical protein
MLRPARERKVWKLAWVRVQDCSESILYCNPYFNLPVTERRESRLRGTVLTRVACLVLSRTSGRETCTVEFTDY